MQTTRVILPEFMVHKSINNYSISLYEKLIDVKYHGNYIAEIPTKQLKDFEYIKRYGQGYITFAKVAYRQRQFMYSERVLKDYNEWEVFANSLK